MANLRPHPHLKPQWGRMRIRASISSTAIVGIAIVALIAYSRITSADGPGAYAIKDAQIVTGKGAPVAKGTVVFRDGLITEVGPNVRIPADARVIDGTGLTVYPGLIDGYTSLGLPAPAQPQPQGGGRGGGPQPAGPQQAPPDPTASHGNPSAAAADQVRPGGTAIEDARSAGVTSALTSSRQGIMPGQSALINLAGAEGSKMVVRSPVALTVQFSSGGGFGGGYPGSLMGTVAFIRQSFYDAVHYRDKIARYERIKRGVSRPEHDKKLAALQPALNGTMPVLFIANSDGDIRRALMISEEFKLKPIVAGAAFSYRVADLLKSRNVPVILSVDFPKRAADLPDDEDESLRVLRERAEAPTAAATLAKAGVKFAFMSGSLRPQEFVSNVQKAVESGLPKEEALRALTVNAAEILGAGDQLGTVETGKIANLVVTSGDLFAKDVKVRHVFIDGAEVEVKKPETPAQRFGGPGGRGERPPTSVDAAGDWSLVVQSPQGEMNVKLSVRKDGDRLSGTMESPMGSTPLSNVSLNGNQIRFSATVPAGGQSIDMTGSGTIEGDSIRGVFNLGPHGSVDFSGTRPR